MISKLITHAYNKYFVIMYDELMIEIKRAIALILDKKEHNYSINFI